MKKATLILFCLTLAAIFTAAQPGKKPAPKPTNQPDMNKLLEEAMHVQRSGDLRRYAEKMEVINKLEKEIEEIRAATP